MARAMSGAWNTLVESLAASAGTRFESVAGPKSVVTPLSAVETKDSRRIASGLEEFDRVLGGGLVAGGVVLLGGDPGIGKSTLLLQASAVSVVAQAPADRAAAGTGPRDRISKPGSACSSTRRGCRRATAC